METNRSKRPRDREPAGLTSLAERRERALQALLQQLDDDSPSLIAYDEDMIQLTIDKLVKDAGYPAGTMHTIAVKACPLTKVLLMFKARSFGAEVASMGELQQALRAGFHPDKIVFDSPCKTRSELKFALQTGVRMNVDNMQELERVDCILKESPELLRQDHQLIIGVRINPQVGSGSIAALSTGGLVSKFGVPLLEQRHQLLDAFRSRPWLNALHLHVGSQGVPLELAIKGAVQVWELAKEINSLCNEPRIKMFDIGGGMPVDYSQDLDADAAELAERAELARSGEDLEGGLAELAKRAELARSGEDLEGGPAELAKRVELERSGEDLEGGSAELAKRANLARPSKSGGEGGHGEVFAKHARLLKAAVPELFEDGSICQLVTENGRSLVAKCAFAASTVEYTKSCGGRHIAVLSFGADLFTRTAYLPSVWPLRLSVHAADGRQKTDPSSSTGSVNEGIVTDVVGPLCFQGDMLANARLLPLTEPGDIIVVVDAGAYTLSNWSVYNSRASPPVFGFSFAPSRQRASRQLDGHPSATDAVGVVATTRKLRDIEGMDQVTAFWD